MDQQLLKIKNLRRLNRKDLRPGSHQNHVVEPDSSEIALLRRFFWYPAGCKEVMYGGWQGTKPDGSLRWVGSKGRDSASLETIIQRWQREGFTPALDLRYWPTSHILPWSRVIVFDLDAQPDSKLVAAFVLTLEKIGYMPSVAVSTLRKSKYHIFVEFTRGVVIGPKSDGTLKAFAEHVRATGGAR